MSLLEKVKSELITNLPSGWKLTSIEEGITSLNEGNQAFFYGDLIKADGFKVGFMLKAKVPYPVSTAVLICESSTCQFFLKTLSKPDEKLVLESALGETINGLTQHFKAVEAPPPLPPPFPHPPLGGAPPIPKLPPPELARPYIPEPEQGCHLPCPYCENVRKAGAKCPLCKGAGAYFRPSQMMDRFSSFRRVVDFLSEIVKAEDEAGGPREEEAAKILHRQYLTLLENLCIYTFSARNFVSERIKELEEEFGLE